MSATPDTQADAKAAENEAPPRRGRPPRFSREQIVEAVADMLLADPAGPLTIARAADAVGAKPMSLYRHFADRDDLVAAVTAHVFADTRPALDDGRRWQERISTWMRAVSLPRFATPIRISTSSGEALAYSAVTSK